MENFIGIDAHGRNEMERRGPCPNPCLLVLWIFGGLTNVDDDGDAVGKGEVTAESALHDIEVLT